MRYVTILIVCVKASTLFKKNVSPVGTLRVGEQSLETNLNGFPRNSVNILSNIAYIIL